MTHKEKVIASAYTGTLFCDFSDVHQYIEEKLGRAVFTHEMASKEVQEEIHEACKEDFLAMLNAEPQIVRCGECKHLTNDRICPRWERICELTGGGKAENGFCDEGERRADDE